MEHIPIKRAGLSDLSKRLSKKSDVFTITEHGHPTMVVMSYEKYREIEDTLECVADGDIIETLRRSKQDIDAGRVLTEEEADHAIGW